MLVRKNCITQLRQTKVRNRLTNPSGLKNFRVSNTKAYKVLSHPGNMQVPQLSHTKIGQRILGNLKNTKFGQTLGHLSEVQIPSLKQTKLGQWLINLLKNIKI